MHAPTNKNRKDDLAKDAKTGMDSVPLVENSKFKEIQAQIRERDADYKSIGRVGALLLILQVRDPSCRKYEIMKAGISGIFSLYAIRKVGLFGLSKEVPGFTRGRMTEIEQQLRKACEKILGSISDETIETIASEIELSPMGKEALAKKIKAL